MKSFSNFLTRTRSWALGLVAVVALASGFAVAPIVATSLLATATPAQGALSFVTSLRQTRCQAIVTAAGANAVIELRTGSKPATTAGAGALPAVTGTLLATVTSGTTIGTCTAGQLDFDEAGFTQSSGSHVAGTPGYARMKTSGGTAIADIDICGAAPCLTFTGTVTTGQNVTMTNILFTDGNV